MNIELKQAAQDAAEAIDWLLKNIRRDAPQLSGKAMGNAEKCATALRTALAQRPTTGEPIGQVFYAVDGGDDETDAGYHMKPYVHWFDKALAADTKLYTRPMPSLPDAITTPAEDGTEYDFASGHAAKQDAAALNWIERQYLEELGMGLVIDAPNDGKYYVCGDSGTTHYGKTLREAVASAIAEGV